MWKKKTNSLIYCLLTCNNSNRLVRDGHALAHMIMCGDIDGVHLATGHIIQSTVGVIGGAGDREALLCPPLDRVVLSTRGEVPQHLANGEVVLAIDVFRDAWL